MAENNEQIPASPIPASPKYRDREDATAHARRELESVSSNIGKISDDHSELSIANFDTLITNNKKIVILDVNAEWCKPCIAFAKVLNELTALFPDDIEVVKLTTDKNPEAEDLTIKLEGKGYSPGTHALPTVVCFKDGKLQKEINGTPQMIDFLTLLKSQGLKMPPQKRKAALLITAKYYPNNIFEQIQEIEPEYQRECLLVVAEKYSLYTLSILSDNYDKYKNLPFLKEIIRKAVETAIKTERGGEEVLRNYTHLFAGEEYAMDVLSSIANESPAIFVELYYSTIKKNLPSNKIPAANDLFEKCVFNLVDNNREAFMRNAHTIIDHQFSNGGQGYGITLLDDLIDRDPADGLIAPEQYEHLEDAEKRLKNALERTLVTKPDMIFEYQYAIFDDVHIIKDPKYEERIIKAATRKVPSVALEKCYYFDEKPYYLPVVKIAVEELEKQAPQALFDHMDVLTMNVLTKVLGEKRLQRLLSTQCKAFPDLCLREEPYISDLPYGDKLLEDAKKSPKRSPK